MKPETFDSTGTPFWGSFQVGQELNSKIMEFTGANFSAAVNFAMKLSSVKSPGEFADVLTTHTRDNIKMLTEELEELSSIIKTSSSKGERLFDSSLRT